MTHREVQELLGAYALDAVDGDEAEAVEAHLRECPRCREEVAAHRETAAFLASAGSPAPDGLWERIASELDEPPPELTLGRIVPMQKPTRRWPLTAMTAVAAALVLLLGAVVVRQSQRLDTLESRQSFDQALASAMANPDARQVKLESSSGADVTAQAIVLPDGTGFVVAQGLPPLDAGRTYQLWGVTGEQAISLGLLGGRPGVVAFHATPTMDALAVTAEQAGGVVVSRETPVVVGQVPREA